MLTMPATSSRDVHTAASFCLYRTRLEATTFASEFVALLICKELSVALRYKLRASIPKSTLTMTNNAIHYLSARKAAAAGILSETG